MDATIRRARPTDHAQVARLLAETDRFHTALLPDVFRIAEPIATAQWYGRTLAQPGGTILVAEASGVLRGVLWITEQHTPEDAVLIPRRYAYIEEVVVAEGHRGQGIGSALLREAERWAQSRGIDQVVLSVWEANDEAIGFYQHLGYETVRRRMRKPLLPGR